MIRPQSGQIKELFGRVAWRYDLANAVLSLGIHGSWRRALARWSGVGPGQTVLDCAAGTGDQALVFKRAVGASGLVVASDFCLPMLLKVPGKACRKGLPLACLQADTLHLPHPDNTFDLASIAFGMRNVADPVAAIKEMARVTRPGGQVMVLEFGQVKVPILRQLYRLFSTRVMPLVGGLITGRKDAYRYLEQSAAQFPCGPEFAQLLEQAGAFCQVEHRSLTAGIAYMYRGTVR